MCSRSCTRVFSEPTNGLKVSFVYVYKTRLLLYKATTLQVSYLPLFYRDYIFGFHMT